MVKTVTDESCRSEVQDNPRGSGTGTTRGDQFAGGLFVFGQYGVAVFRIAFDHSGDAGATDSFAARHRNVDALFLECLDDCPICGHVDGETGLLGNYLECRCAGWRVVG